MKIEPIVLEGKFVRLEPLQIEHLDQLWEVGNDESVWRWTVNIVRERDDLKRYVETALRDQRRGVCLPFVTIDKSENKIVGSTRFANIDTENKHVEIGWTWINPNWQRSFINTEAKLLMLGHAFKIWNCFRVELKTDALNEKSRNAIMRIGAKEEGVFRKNLITESGRIRDTVYFSVIDAEWQTVKENLSEKLQRVYS